MRERRASGDIILDRRRASRTPIGFDVEWCMEGRGEAGTARNLTRHGIFVESETPLPAGARLELTLHLPDGDAPAKVIAEVARPARRRDEPPGFGASFGSLDDATSERIAAVLAASVPGR